MQVFGKKPTLFSGKNKGGSSSDRQDRLPSRPESLSKKNIPKLPISTRAGNLHIDRIQKPANSLGHREHTKSQHLLTSSEKNEGPSTAKRAVFDLSKSVFEVNESPVKANHRPGPSGEFSLMGLGLASSQLILGNHNTSTGGPSILNDLAAIIRARNNEKTGNSKTATHARTFTRCVEYLDKESEHLFQKNIRSLDKYLVPMTDKDCALYADTPKDTRPVFELKESIPKSLEVSEAKGAYVWIECADKKFPAHITMDASDIEFDFYINYNQVDVRTRRTQSCVRIDTAITNNASVNSSIWLQPKKSGILDAASEVQLEAIQNVESPSMIMWEKFEKPTKYHYETLVTGNMVNIQTPKRSDGSEKKFNHMTVLIVPSKRTRVSVSISFSNPR